MTTIVLERVRLYDAILSILHQKKEATLGEILDWLQKLASKNLLHTSLEDVMTTLTLGTLMKTLEYRDGKYRIRMKPTREYRRLLEEIIRLVGE